MAVFDDLVKNPAPGGLAVGIGAALLGPVLLPAVSGMLRPVAAAALRTGIAAYRGAVEPLRASIDSLVAEAQIELATARAGAAHPGPRTAASASEPAAEPGAVTSVVSARSTVPAMPPSPATPSAAASDPALRAAGPAHGTEPAAGQDGHADHPRSHKPRRGGTHPA